MEQTGRENGTSLSCGTMFLPVPLHQLPHHHQDYACWPCSAQQDYSFAPSTALQHTGNRCFVLLQLFVHHIEVYHPYGSHGHRTRYYASSPNRRGKHTHHHLLSHNNLDSQYRQYYDTPLCAAPLLDNKHLSSHASPFPSKSDTFQESPFRYSMCKPDVQPLWDGDALPPQNLWAIVHWTSL